MVRARALVGRELGGAALDGPVAARREGAAGDALAGARRPAGDAAQGVLAGEVGDGGQQLARVGMVGAGEELLLGADLDQAAGVHDGDAIGQVGDHRQVVGHVEGRDAVGARQLANRLEHVGLRGDVERRRGLVEDDHLGPVGEAPWRSPRAAAGRRRADAGSGAGRPGRWAAAPRPSSPRDAPRARPPRLPKECASRISMSCVPMRRAGLSAAEASCGT